MREVSEIPEEVMQIAVAIGHVQYLHVLPFEYRAALSEAIAQALMKEREERDRLREENERLRQFLRPFANIGIGTNPDYEPMIRMDRDAIVRARAALEGDAS